MTATPHQGTGCVRTTPRGVTPRIAEGQAERMAQQIAEAAARSKAECELRMQQDAVAYPSDSVKVRGEVETTVAPSGRTVDVVQHKDGTRSYMAVAVAEGTTSVSGMRVEV